MSRECILFVTGKLAEPSLRQVLAELAPQEGWDYRVEVLGISVAALLHVDLVARRLRIPADINRIILPGWCQGDLELLSRKYGLPVECGPKDLFDLPVYFGNQKRPPVDLSRYDIEILAEINHAPRLTKSELFAQAESFRASGADLIDLGCIPGESWRDIGDITRALIDEGFRVSVDSFERNEVSAAVKAGAELVLSCNSTNLEWARDLDVELVAIPDDPRNLESLDPILASLAANHCRYRIDPILEPIGFGFSESLFRYYRARDRWPDTPMMMGIGNVTELSEVDSAGINFLLASICQELGIHSVLTTEVINWASSSVAEFDFARRLIKHAIEAKVLPKHVDSRLVMLRDSRLRKMSAEELQQISDQLTDPSFRIFVEGGTIHLMNREGYWKGSDPYELFDQMMAESPGVDASHAFYLGYELSKAVTALTLKKQYRQDQALRWGLLTVEEISAVERRRQQREKSETEETGENS